MVQLLCSCGSGWCDLSVSGSGMVQLWIIIWLHLDRLWCSFGSVVVQQLLVASRSQCASFGAELFQIVRRGVACGAVVQLGVIPVCNECTQFQFGSALQQLGVA